MFDKIIANNQLPDENIQKKIICHIHNICPNIKIEILSKSLCKRNIYMFKIGNVYNNPVLFTGTFHGMEWLTGVLLLKYLETLCTSIKNKSLVSGIDVCHFLENRGLIIIPFINPDGVEISIHGPNSACHYKNLVKEVSNNNTSSWQANARGIDLNHNFPAKWCELHNLEIESGIIKPAPTRFGGFYPASEPETKSLIQFVCNNNIRQAFAFHSQGEEIYWDFGEYTPKKSKLIAKILSASSGYAISEPSGLAVGGGFKDWFITKFRKPAFTVEIGKGKNPLPLSDLNNIYQQIEEMLTIATII